MSDNIEKAPNVPPFVTFVTSAVPMVFDNSMSYYEALCALWKWLQDDVIDVINNNASVTEQYITLTNELKEFVETYFDNLDVQQEINNKLDAMAESGELLALIKPYIDPIFDAQNERISDLEEMVENAASGSPAGVYATVSALTTADPDHSRIYVVQADGHWYYYANSQWNDGGAYQTAMSASDVDKLEYRVNVLSDTTDNVFDIERLASATGWSLSADGVASGTLVNLRDSFDDTDLIINFNGATRACIELTARNTGSDTSTSRGLTIDWVYHDGTTGRNALTNDKTTWTTLTAQSSSVAKQIDYIKFSYGGGGNNTWEIKDVKCILGKRTIPVDFPNHYTAKDLTAREGLVTLDNKIDELTPTISVDNVYGIKIATDGTVTRTQGAVGKDNDYIIGNTMHGSGTNDFDLIFPWCDIKLCNIKTDYDGTEHIYYEDDAEFARDGSNGDVMVEIPKFYTKRYFDEDGADNIEISGLKRSGFILEPAFVNSETGEELEHIYVGAYLANINNGKLESKSGAFPLTNMSIASLKQNEGEIYDFVTLQALQKLIIIEFGTINMSPILGGLSDMVWSSCKARETVSNTNTAIFGGASYINSLVVGSTVGVGDTFGIVQNRTITAIEEVDTNVRRITFDGDPVDVTNNVTYLYSTGQKSGMCDALTYHTGRNNLVAGQSMQNQFIYRNIEGLWGNLGEYMEGITVKRLKAYWSNIKSDYDDITKCKKLNFAIPLQDTYINSVDAKPQQIKKMGLDFHSPEIMLPSELATYDNTYYGDSFFSFYDKDAEGHDIDPDREYCGISSMSLDGKQYNGLFTLRFWVPKNGNLSRLYGTRLIKRS